MENGVSRGTMSSSSNDIEEVRQYWDRRPCNIRHSPQPVGARLFRRALRRASISSSRTFLASPSSSAGAERRCWRSVAASAPIPSTSRATAPKSRPWTCPPIRWRSHIRDAAHVDRREHRGPRHRSVLGRSPGADSRHAVGITQGRHRADTVCQDRRRPRRGARGPALGSGDLEPDPRRARHSRSRP